jgi:hypothetical protein
MLRSAGNLPWRVGCVVSPMFAHWLGRGKVSIDSEDNSTNDLAGQLNLGCGRHTGEFTKDPFPARTSPSRPVTGCVREADFWACRAPRGRAWLVTTAPSPMLNRDAALITILNFEMSWIGGEITTHDYRTPDVPDLIHPGWPLPRRPNRSVPPSTFMPPGCASCRASVLIVTGSSWFSPRSEW